MLTIGQKLENGIESLLSLSTEIADLQYKFENALKDLSMYNSLIEIQKYLGSGSDLNELLPSIEDAIAGVFGTNWCKIIIDENDINKMPVGTCLNMEKLNALELDKFYIDDKTKIQMFGVNEGKLGILRMHLMDDTFGYIILYWGFLFNLTDNNVRFLELLKSQLEISIINAQLLSKFKNMSIIDPLTGIFNRTYFNNFIEKNRPEEGHCIIMIDIDDFKRVNDSNGHASGDKVLKELAAVLKENCEGNDMAIRYGGEEFVIVTFGGHDALECANNIRKGFELKTGYSVSTGIAIATGSDEELSYAALCELADLAMYQSKQKGKNRTTVFKAE